MSLQTWVETLVTAQADSTALSNSTTATSIIPAGARVTVPANYFYIGKTLRIRASGRISTVTATPGNFTFTLQFGTITTPISVFTSQATALNTTAQTNATWDLELMSTCRAIGSGTSANMITTGKWTTRASLNAPAVGTTTGVGVVLLPDTAPATGTGFASTDPQTIDLFGTWSTANASNSILTHIYSVESMN